MYETFFNFKTLPFENTPNPLFFYASEQHREALAAIEYTIRMRKGIVLVTGDIGSGKTTVGRTMMHRCSKKATIVLLLHGHLTANELIRHVCRTLQLPTAAQDDHAQLLEKLQQYLLEQARRGQPVVLFVDEAQTLSDDALEELRLLSNFDTDTQRLLQLVLVGQPELRDRIAKPELNALRQRIVLAKRLAPLSIQETANYLQHRLRAASEDPDQVQVSFSGEAIQAIYAATGGTPRLINVIADNCLLLGYVKTSRRIGASMVNRVVQDMVPSFGDPGTQTTLSLAGNF